ncbi:hypothetical protein BJ322DRAFT_1051458 [Thelephora terrestris]|uniref:DUF726-domain-containing protein n=1 Tax=Thelephora terrestris TaxID=56493 RepID=A0A9P6HIH5_9AGAM|nr:hypothetical protein BJ322DRAFT_1051458 [Thelephora terrestris]
MPIKNTPPVDLLDDDDEGWQDMPVIKEDTEASGFDEEDCKKYHYRSPVKTADAGNARGDLIDFDDEGSGWRSKRDQNESEYTRLRVKEEDDTDEVHLRTKYLFDEDKAMTPLSQMQATKDLLTEAQRVAYVGLCALTTKEMIDSLAKIGGKEVKLAAEQLNLWALKILGRLYYHMELETAEQKMIESLALHGIQAEDLTPPLMTTHTVANPEYDPEAAKRLDEERAQEPDHPGDDDDDTATLVETADPSRNGTHDNDGKAKPGHAESSSDKKVDGGSTHKPPAQTTARVLEEGTATGPMAGVSVSLSFTDENVTLDIRWTVLCDLFLILIADSVYDSRSRVLLEKIAHKLGLGWLDVVKFEQRVTEALEIQEEVESLENSEVIDGRRKSAKKKRMVMLGLATLGGGLVIGLSAGLMAPLIGAGIGAALGTVGIGGASGFLAGTAGAAVITTAGTLTGSGIAVRGMARRTQQVQTFELLPLHNNKRVNCILTVPGFMNSLQDDVRLPFSVLDPIVGDVWSVLWEPEMIRETGDALKILTSEVLTQVGQTVLQTTVMATLMTALQWPIILTKLGYLIDNPWSNALDRARAAGGILADVLIQRHLGVRPITLIGFSLGSRVIFYALLELARKKAFGIVQDVIIMGSTVTAPIRTWIEARSVVAGRFVNAYARNDWLLNYLFRATSGGLNTIAGLRPLEGVPGLENVDVTDKIAGHMSYRMFMPLILDQLGFPVSSDHFDEPKEPDFKGDRVVMKESETTQNKGWFGRKKKSVTASQKVSRPPSASSFTPYRRKSQLPEVNAADEDLPPREEFPERTGSPGSPSQQIEKGIEAEETSDGGGDAVEPTPAVPLHAGFDFSAIKDVLRESKETDGGGTQTLSLSPVPEHMMPPASPIARSGSAPPYTSTHHPLTPSQLSRTFARGECAGEDGISDDITPAFSRSFSLVDTPSTTRNNDFTSVNKTLFPEVPTKHPLPSNSPQLSFGSYDGNIWQASSTHVQQPGTATSTQSLSLLGEGRDNGSYSHLSSSPSIDSFVSRSPLQFGGPGGTIGYDPSTPIVSPPNHEADPWSSLTRGKKPTNGFNSNPWA